MTNNTDSAIRARIETFVDELTGQIRDAALEAVQEALSGETRATPGRKKRRKAKATKTTKKKRVRRTAAQVEATAQRILAHVKAKPGKRLGAIAKSLRMETKDVRGPAFALVAAKKLKTTGQRGGTRYFAKGAAPRKAAKKATKRKTAKKKAVKRKATKRKGGKRATAHGPS